MFPTDPNPAHERPQHDPAADAAPAPVRPGPWASRFEELQVEVGGDVVVFVRVRNNTAGQHVALFGSGVLFTAFVATLPLLHLTLLGNGFWILVGLIVLVIVALVMHARVETTKLELNRLGLTVDQGTELDHESAVVLWGDLAGCDLEPVSETDGRKGMQLRLRPRQGEPIDCLGGVGVGELNDVRRVILETLNRHRQQPPVRGRA